MISKERLIARPELPPVLPKAEQALLRKTDLASGLSSSEKIPIERVQGLVPAPVTAIVPKETKNADQFSKPQKPELENLQLDLYQKMLCSTHEQRNELSNAVDLWDSVPRYSMSRQEMTKLRVSDKFLEPHTRSFQHRGKSYTCVVAPVYVMDLDGVGRYFYPSASEELVEDALRKLATEQQAGYFDRPNNRSGVVFTLHALREEMRRRGHARSYQEIVQSLNILAHSVLDIIPHGPGELRFTSACLPMLAAVSRDRLVSDPDSKWAVQFHPLVTSSIDRVQYRQFNYRLMMSHSTQLARWAHKQLVLKYTFADHLKPFDMRYSTIRRDSGLLDAYIQERHAVRALDRAFAELKQNGVVSSYERTDERGLRKKIIDVVFTIYPSQDFIREAKAASRRQADATRTLMPLDKKMTHRR